MVMRFAIVEGGIIENITLAEPGYAAEQGWIELPEGSGIGWALVDGVWEAPPPAPLSVPQSLTFAQLLIGLVTEAWITEAEGEAWLAGVLPAQVTALIATLPVEQQFAAKARAARPSEVLRMDPFVVSMGAAHGKTPEELDQFFRTYSGV